MDSTVRLQKLAMKDIRQVVDLLVSEPGAEEVKLFKHLEAHVEDERWLFLLAREGHKPAGVIECCRDESASLSGSARRGWVRTLFVAEPWRRQGVARQLLQTASYWFDAAQVSSVQMEIAQEQAEDLAPVLERLGFEASHTIFSRA